MSAARANELALRWLPVHWWLYGILAVLLAFGLASEVILNVAEVRNSFGWIRFFNLSYEGNLPTLYSALLLLACSGLLFFIATITRAANQSHSAHWYGLAAIFLYISADEAVIIHETLNEPLRDIFNLGGALYFAWVIPFAAAVMVIAAIYFRFWLVLPSPIRIQFALAAAIFVGGAMGTELPISAWYDVHGGSNLTYGLLNLLQEGLEILGVSIFLSALLRYLAEEHDHVALTFSNSESETPA
jgi:hypothetical protein